ncbi:MAG: hypothetical protein AAB815_03875, partial [Patescibacteria group bacterium]
VTSQSAQEPSAQEPFLRKGNKEPGRNDPCPCGAINPVTGEVYKYKKCGMINASQHRKSLVN